MEITRVCADCEGFEPPCCECHRLNHCCHACYLYSPKRNNEHPRFTEFDVMEDANISNPPDEVSWYQFPVVYWLPK